MNRGMDDFDPMILESHLLYPKTLDETVLVAREKAIQEVLLPKNVAHENVVVASMEVTERGGTEAASFDLSHSTELDVTTEHGACAENQPPQEQGPTSLMKPYGKGCLVIEQQYEGADSGSPWNSPAGGADGRTEVIASGEKKRKRCSKKSSGGGTHGRTVGKAGGEKKRKNWTDDETEMLLKIVPQETKLWSRIDKFSDSEPSWDDIAKELVSGRTGDECRRRMDTLMKSYKAIKEYCENQKIEVLQLNEEDFEDMILVMPKLATHFKGSWYKYVRDYCPPRSNKKMRKQGAGSSLENRAAMRDAMRHEEPSCDVKHDIQASDGPSAAREQPQHTSAGYFQCHPIDEAGLPTLGVRRENSSYLLQHSAPVHNTDLWYAAIDTPNDVPPRDVEDLQTMFLPQEFCFDFNAEDFTAAVVSL